METLSLATHPIDSSLKAPNPELQNDLVAPVRGARKRKAPTLRADDWEPYKSRIVQLHITQGLSLNKVKGMITEEFGFAAEYVTILYSNLSFVLIPFPL